MFVNAVRRNFKQFVDICREKYDMTCLGKKHSS